MLRAIQIETSRSSSGSVTGRGRVSPLRCRALAGLLLTLPLTIHCTAKPTPEPEGPDKPPTSVNHDTPPQGVAGQGNLSQGAAGQGTVVQEPAPARSIAFTSPTEGLIVKPEGNAGTAAAVPVTVSIVASGVQAVEVRLGNDTMATLTSPPWQTTVNITGNGSHDLQAIGRDGTGQELVRAIRTIEVQGLEGSCLDELKAKGVAFKPASPAKEITDPVVLEPTIEGVTFRVHKAAKPSRMTVACELGLRLHRLAKLAAENGLDEVIHMGIHNYRTMRNPTCIKNNNCKLSQHAYAKAIDIHAFGVAGKEATYSTETDWVINKQASVCPGKPQGEADTILHKMACLMHTQKLFNVILTPNYNALHRNHFHVDLTPASATIRGEDMGVDPINEELLDD